MPNVIEIITAPAKAAGGLVSLPVKAAGGLINKLRGSENGGLNDPALKAKVESELYRLPGVSRSNVNVTVADGVVTVHGTAAGDAQIATIQTVIGNIPEVQGFESELHVPSKPAPTRPGARKATTPKRPPAKRTPAESADTASKLAPTPAEIAATGQGRPPAPMGSTEEPS